MGTAMMLEVGFELAAVLVSEHLGRYHVDYAAGRHIKAMRIYEH